MHFRRNRAHGLDSIASAKRSYNRHSTADPRSRGREPSSWDPQAKKGSPLRAGLEALVLSALAARSAEAVVVISAEQSISFYSGAAAKLLRLPLPAEPMTLAEMRLQHPLFETESVTNPLATAISEHRTAEGEVFEVLPDGVLRTYWVKTVPFFDAGRYLGAATYMTVVAERPSV
jgi:hypothetical protein